MAVESVRVLLDIFSGNPNPTWHLTAVEAGRFVEKLAALPETAGTELPGHLGYRGFVVVVLRDGEESRVRVHKGIVELPQADSTSFRSDNGRELERWLLNSGLPFLNSDLLALVDRELTGS